MLGVCISHRNYKFMSLYTTWHIPAFHEVHYFRIAKGHGCIDIRKSSKVYGRYAAKRVNSYRLRLLVSLNDEVFILRGVFRVRKHPLAFLSVLLYALFHELLVVF